MKNILIIDQFKTKKDYDELKITLEEFELFRTPLQHALKELAQTDFMCVIVFKYREFGAEIIDLVSKIKRFDPHLEIVFVGEEIDNIVDDYQIYDCIEKNFKKIARTIRRLVEYKLFGKIYLANSSELDTLRTENDRLSRKLSQTTKICTDLLNLIE